jgi:hypothetical protein
LQAEQERKLVWQNGLSAVKASWCVHRQLIAKLKLSLEDVHGSVTKWGEEKHLSSGVGQ